LFVLAHGFRELSLLTLGSPFLGLL
jgi:hypothetical protein